MEKVKGYYEKMVDYKRFAFILVAITAFLYIGTLLPFEGKTLTKTYVLMGGSVGFIFISCLLFYLSYYYRKVLLESEEGQEYLTKNRR